MRDVLRYEGKRVVVTGAGSAVGAATVALLVELGAEVHTIGVMRPPATGIASFTECDLRDPTQVDVTVAKIGSILNALFNCAPAPEAHAGRDDVLAHLDAVRHVTEAVIPLMPEGSAIVSVAARADADEPVRAYTAERSGPLAEAGIRINCVNGGSAGTPAGAGSAEQLAWPLVFLNSPRAAAVTGACVGAGA